jgi:hypothetical protein
MILLLEPGQNKTNIRFRTYRMKLSIITTLPHYLAILYTKGDYVYNTFILLSTTFSITIMSQKI